MITGVLFYDAELMDNLKTLLWEGMKIFKKKHNHEVTAIALNKNQFEVDDHKSVLALFERKGITILFLNDVNKNHYQVGRRSDEFLGN